MVAIPSLQEEDAKRPTRERENLVGERTRIINRMKACLVRFGIRNFNPTLRTAPERLNALCTPEGVSLPPNTLAELRRDLARLRFVMDQINAIEVAACTRVPKFRPPSYPARVFPELRQARLRSAFTGPD
jgi:transposase